MKSQKAEFLRDIHPDGRFQNHLHPQRIRLPHNLGFRAIASLRRDDHGAGRGEKDFY
jgi:hypothetical protein